MLDVQCRYLEAQLQRGNADSEILKRHRKAEARKFTFQAAHHPRYLQCHRVDRNIVAKPINECQSSLFPGGVIGTVRAVRKFGDSDNGNTDVNPAIRRFDLFEDLKNRTILPFGCDHETGIEN